MQRYWQQCHAKGNSHGSKQVRSSMRERIIDYTRDTIVHFGILSLYGFPPEMVGVPWESPRIFAFLPVSFRDEWRVVTFHIITDNQNSSFSSCCQWQWWWLAGGLLITIFFHVVRKDECKNQIFGAPFRPPPFPWTGSRSHVNTIMGDTTDNRGVWESSQPSRYEKHFWIFFTEYRFVSVKDSDWCQSEEDEMSSLVIPLVGVSFFICLALS